jgi:hypothetical protein
MSDFWDYTVIISDDDYTELVIVTLARDDDAGACEYARLTFAANLGHAPGRYRTELMKKEKQSG